MVDQSVINIEHSIIMATLRLIINCSYTVTTTLIRWSTGLIVHVYNDPS